MGSNAQRTSNDIKDCNFYVVAVPTPVDNDNRLELKAFYGALPKQSEGLFQKEILSFMNPPSILVFTKPYN